ncbi:AraC family transcriptional regulator [Paenibacillus gansuensis]|uniref:AraC family transcriptional regulator n=1 Tax=Paenibacillus gansuensis TaxID=306542 RepID=A0ABW5PA94_9BACL
MKKLSYFVFTCPPVPHFIAGWEDLMPAGKAHVTREPIGVFDLLYVEDGVMPIREGDNEWELSGGELLILRPDRAHGGPAGCRRSTFYYWVHFHAPGLWMEVDSLVNVPPVRQAYKDDQLNNQSTYQVVIPRSIKVRDTVSMGWLFRELVALNYTLDNQRKFKQQYLFQKLLLSIAVTEGAETNFIPNTLAHRIAAYLQERYRQPITYRDLEAEFHFHQNYISKVFKHAFGCTPHVYLMKWRIDAARQLLEDSQEEIRMIAERCGFIDSSNFTKGFAAIVGITPREYRKMKKNPRMVRRFAEG